MSSDAALPESASPAERNNYYRRTYFDPKNSLGTSNIDRHGQVRTRPMEVLSLSISRSGTASMKVALHLLGYGEVYHFLSIFQNMPDADIWNPLLRAKFLPSPYHPGQTPKTSDPDPQTIDWRKEFDQVLGNCGAVTDLPAYYFAAELIAAYPEAKIIIVERPVERWMKSYEPLFTSVWDPFFRILAKLDPVWLGRMLPLNLVPSAVFFRARNEAEMRANAPAVYKEHYRMIRKLVPKDRLLEYELGSGWEPICRFLGKGVPEVPFPHVNENVALQDWIDLVAKRGVLNALKNVGMCLGALLVAGVAVRWGVS